MVVERGRRDPRQPPLHGAAGLEQAAQVRSAHRRQRRRARPHHQADVERARQVDLVRPARPRAADRRRDVQAGAGAPRAKDSTDERSPRRTPRPYALRGIVRCGICGRKMQGSWNHDRPHYRCTFLSQYAAKNKSTTRGGIPARRPAAPAARRLAVRKFSPGRSADRARPRSRPARRAEAGRGAQREIADCDAKLTQHRAALEAGADPVSSRAGSTRPRPGALSPRRGSGSQPDVGA